MFWAWNAGTMKRLLIALIAAAAFLAGCDAVSTLKDGLAQSDAVATQLEKSVGSKPYVGFNWNNGRLNSVTVTFQGLPADKTAGEVADLARAAIKQQFKQEPGQIVLAFSINP